MKLTKFRDPVYGYIEIDDEIVHDIIDTAAFQRLRQIRQTSYEPLYPSSLHNRFVHSLGVYYLGKKAIAAFYGSLCWHKTAGTRRLEGLKELFDTHFGEQYGRLFILSCLLHDVGHSPFSHTGEEFYRNSVSTAPVVDIAPLRKELNRTRNSKKKAALLKKLEEARAYTYRKHLAYLTKDNVFISPAGEAPAPHEIMSCIVALEAFGQNPKYFKDDRQRAFFARCITGLLYTDREHLKREEYVKMTATQDREVQKQQLLDCLIQLLHSSVIDVDRLDYIIRDASTMGYQSVSIDYERLLSGIVAVRDGEYNFTVGFHKNALSIIENAVYAHDIEKKWVQSHPAILYDSFLLQQTIIDIEARLREDNKNSGFPPASTLFSYDSLTGKGSTFKDLRIRYLADPDLVYLMKNKYTSVYAEEYFSRDTRRVPMWKSEAEFKNLFRVGERETISRAMEIILTDGTPKRTSAEVSERTIKKIDQDIADARAHDLANMVETHEKKRAYFLALLKVCREHGLRENVLLLSTAFFKSNFSKQEMNRLLILFPAGEQIHKLQDVSSTLNSRVPPDERFTYLFYYPKPGRVKADAVSSAQALVDAFKKYE